MHDHERNGTTMNDPDTTRHTTADDVGRSLRIVVAIAIAAALVLVALDNRRDVRVGYVVGDAQAPIWIVLVAAAIAGIVIAWLAKHRPHHRS
jgi:uncharacterized integral membrane protein